MFAEALKRGRFIDFKNLNQIKEEGRMDDNIQT
jgi:hypothetical protein